jgi:hypothetical protein
MRRARRYPQAPAEEGLECVPRLPDSASLDPSASSVILMLFFRELRLGPRSTLANPAKRYPFGGGATEIVSPGVV